MVKKIDFDTFYESEFEERWPSLKKALLKKHELYARKNRFAVQENIRLSPIYHMDYASVVVAESLDVKPNEDVLDMCAAPGGKSLILAEKLFLLEKTTGSLTLNEPSAERRRRLEKVLTDYVPADIRSKISVLQKKGELLFKTHAESFDKILLDAPCSSEAHVLATPKALKEWTPARPRQLAQRQYDLLCSALSCLKPGGTLVYSTCALLPLENDAVIERVLERAQKKKQKLDFIRLQDSSAEHTEYGAQFLPDQPRKLGPMYYSKLHLHSNG